MFKDENQLSFFGAVYYNFTTSYTIGTLRSDSLECLTNYATLINEFQGLFDFVA